MQCLPIHAQVQEWPSVQMTLRNHTIHTSPAFSGGAQLLAALHLLKHANITTTTPQHHLYHTFIQAIRRSYAYLIHLGKTVTLVLRRVVRPVTLVLRCQLQKMVTVASYTQQPLFVAT